MPKSLTLKEEAFAQAYVDCGMSSEAFRRSYGVKNSNPATIRSNAHKTLKRPHVAERVKELQNEARGEYLITKETQLKRLMYIFEQAASAGELSTALATVKEINKMFGLSSNKLEHSGALEVSLPWSGMYSDASNTEPSA